MPAVRSAAAEARDIRKEYPGGIVALDGVNLCLERGKLTGLIGANGSGKTTLLRVLSGQLAPTVGCIELFGYPISAGRREHLSRIGYVAQDAALDPEMTGMETLVLFGALYRLTRRRLREEMPRLIDRFGLAAFVRRLVGEYSGGQRRRLHLALALIHDPELLLLDEPTTGLDPAGAAMLWSSMRDLCNRHGAVAVVTHNLAEAERNCDQIVVLSSGRVVAEAPPSRLIAEYGGQLLELSVAGTGNDTGELCRRLAGLAGVKGVRLQEGRLMLQIDGGRDAAERLLGAIAEEAEIESFQWHRSDLASAYFALTGTLLTKKRSGEDKGGRRRGRSPKC